MLVGVISDIHGHLSEQAYDALQPCDMILCAGDVERPTILMELDAIAPTVAVLGNCDSSLRGMDIPFTASPRIGGGALFHDASPRRYWHRCRRCACGGTWPHSHSPRRAYRRGPVFEPGKR